MNVFLTGGTGLIGSEVLARLVAGGHQVTALVRSGESASKVESNGATAVQADILDTAKLTDLITPFDAAIHLASPMDDTSAAVDSSIATAVAKAFEGSGKTYVHTGGIWVYGAGNDITEQSPFNPPAITAWRRDVENIVLSGQGFRTSIVEPAIVYGNSGGIPNVIVGSPKNDTGAFELIGDGSQRWTTVYVGDIADLYVLVLNNGSQGYYVGAGGDNPTVREITQAASRAAGSGDVYEGTSQSAASRLGPMAEALLISQQAQGQKAKSDLGWSPSGPSLIDELETGSYSPKA